MKKQVSPKIVSLTFGVLVVSFMIAFYVFAWTEPISPPPAGNVPAPLNTGSHGQEKIGGLVLNTGGAPTGLIVDQGNVGIGTTSNLNSKLNILTDGGSGGLQIGNNLASLTNGGELVIRTTDVPTYKKLLLLRVIPMEV